MMYAVLIVLGLLGVGNPPESVRQTAVNVDSLFVRNISGLKAIVNDSTGHVLTNRNLIDFMWMVSLIGNKDFADPHGTIQIDRKTVSEIERWYMDNKEYITPRNIEKAYNLMYPPARVFESYDTWMEWVNGQYDGLEIEKGP